MVFQKDFSGSKTVLFLSLTLNEWITGGIFMPNDDIGVNVRLNQGWIISAIMQNVPDYEPYAEGETIYEAITSSLLPRVLAPWKKSAGGRENFRRFTGLPIADETSMGISMAGEGYGNYGKWGGILFMFIWGLFVGWFWHLLTWLSQYYPTLLLWTPILFLQVIKAETEFGVVLNYLIKSGFLLAGVVWFIRKQFGIRV